MWLRLFAVFASAAIAGCGLIRQDQVNRGLDAYIGKSLSEVALQFGPPITSFDAGNGKRAFQWEHYGIGQSPGMANRIGNTVVYSAPQAYSTECRLTIVATPAKPNPDPASFPDWWVERWQYHGNGCI